MATALENLITRRDAIAAELAALGTASAGLTQSYSSSSDIDPGGLPNTTGPGTNIDHVGYKMSLYQELNEINKLIAALAGGFDITSQGTP